MIHNLSGKKLLILAGAGVHNKVVRAAKEMGVYTIVTDYLPDSPAKKLANEAWMYDIKEVDSIVERCKKENIDGVINFCIDPGQKPYQEICEKLGLPCFGTKEQFEIMIDKRKFKDFCISHGVDVIPDYSEKDIIDENVEYPIFIKPTNSRGSRGQSICFNKDQAIRAIKFAKSESSDNNFLCEKYMYGKQDIASALWVVNGEPYLVKFGDRHLGNKEDGLEKQVMCTELPAKFSSHVEGSVLPRVKAMIRALGIQFGPVFMQGFVDGDTIRYYDPALRMPGGDYDLVLKQATGFDTVKSLIHFALTGDTKTCFGDPKDAYKLNNMHALLMSVSAHAGKIALVDGLDEMLKHPHVVYVRQIIDVGETIPASGDVQQRVGALGALLPDETYVDDFLNKFYQTYRVLDENGNDMIVSRWHNSEDVGA